MNTAKNDKILFQTVSKDQAKDTGMAMVLLCLLAAYVTKNHSLVGAAIVLLVLDMTVVAIYKPVAVVWLGLSRLLGAVMSRIILSVLFFVIVTPVGMLRRKTGSDSLQLAKWKRGRNSVFKVRDYLFRAEDIEKPY
jgi:hypothetical protein